MADKLHRITGEGAYIRLEFKGDDSRIVPEVSSGLSITSGDIEFNGSLLVSGDVIGVFDGPGALPIGSVIGILPHLSGTYNSTATTVADAQGFVQCNGQTIVDATSPMNCAIIPNINNNIFLTGHTTSGTTGGVNCYTITTVMLPPHIHTADHTHTFNTSEASSTTTGASSAANTADASPATVVTCTFSSANVDSPYPSDYTNTVSADHTHGGASDTSGLHTHTFSRVFCGWNSSAYSAADTNLNIVCTTQTCFTSLAGPHSHGTTSISASDAHTHTISLHSHGSPHTHTLSAHNHTLSSHTHSMNAHTHSIGSLPFAGNSGPGGFANTTIENRPVYLTTKYLIRIK